MIKAGIIGLGKMGISHAAIVSPHPEAELVSVCDTSSLMLDAFKKFTNVNVYSDHVKMIDSEKLDCVVVAGKGDSRFLRKTI
jgi:predicted dehydrogenase